MSEIIESIATTVSVDIRDDAIDEVLGKLEDMPSGLVDDLINDLNEKKNELNVVADDLALKISERLAENESNIIIDRGHVVSGNMAGSVQVFPDGVGSRQVSSTARSDKGYPYPPVIEYGSIFYPGDPFIQDAIDQTDKEVQELVDEVVNEIFG